MKIIFVLHKILDSFHKKNAGLQKIFNFSALTEQMETQGKQ